MRSPTAITKFTMHRPAVHTCRCQKIKLTLASTPHVTVRSHTPSSDGQVTGLTAVFIVATHATPAKRLGCKWLDSASPNRKVTKFSYQSRTAIRQSDSELPVFGHSGLWIFPEMVVSVTILIACFMPQSSLHNRITTPASNCF